MNSLCFELPFLNSFFEPFVLGGLLIERFLFLNPFFKPFLGVSFEPFVLIPFVLIPFFKLFIFWGEFDEKSFFF
ncbi:putative membrane protein [Helicobacter pylori Hp P-25]|nr:putative membrane protein [Helicobacter pylori Hp P-25]